ncbi:hypothetical protein PG993_007056 [Apiospora rasikravindrae]|uniref:Uncharacterized protein n=1 Tax=Apiospora rasikravindrae TaxID=990691 RepID=A0ABR1SY87_9PEZI
MGSSQSKKPTAQREPPKKQLPDSSKESVETQEYEAEIQARFKRRRIWNHLTISRDQTSASDFTNELLATLFRIKLTKRGNARTTPEPAPDTSFNLYDSQEVTTPEWQIPTYQQNIAHQEQLGQQRQRSQSSRKDFLPNFPPTASAAVMSDSSDSSRPKMYTANNDKQMHVLMDGDQTETESYRQMPVVQDSPSSERVEGDNLLERITLLEQENQALKRTQPSPFRYEKLHYLPAETVRSGMSAGPMIGYLDEPSWARGRSGQAAMRCNLPITDVNGFLRQRPDVSFVLAYYYTPSVQQVEAERALLTKQELPRPVPTSESITLHDANMIAAVEQFFALQPNFSDDFPSLNIRASIPAPYLFWYQYRLSNALD